MVIAVNVKRGALAHPELGLLRGCDENTTMLWNELELSRLSGRIAPECE
jgi:hypothetical protein